jgi:hypothetical protein
MVRQREMQNRLARTQCRAEGSPAGTVRTIGCARANADSAEKANAVPDAEIHVPPEPAPPLPRRCRQSREPELVSSEREPRPTDRPSVTGECERTPTECGRPPADAARHPTEGEDVPRERDCRSANASRCRTKQNPCSTTARGRCGDLAPPPDGHARGPHECKCTPDERARGPHERAHGPHKRSCVPHGCECRPHEHRCMPM